MAPPIGQRYHVEIQQPPQTPISLSIRVSLIALSILSLAILPTDWNILASSVFVAVALIPSIPAQPLFIAQQEVPLQRDPLPPQYRYFVGNSTIKHAIQRSRIDRIQ